MINKYKLLDNSGNHLIDLPLEEGNSESELIIANVKCPKCQSDPGFLCQAPDGKEAWIHQDRVKAAPFMKYEPELWEQLNDGI